MNTLSSGMFMLSLVCALACIDLSIKGAKTLVVFWGILSGLCLYIGLLNL